MKKKLLLVLPLLMLTSCDSTPRYKPVKICFLKIQEQSDHEIYFWTYVDLRCTSDEYKDYYNYEITTYEEYHESKWICSVKVEVKNIFDKAFGRTAYSLDEVVDIDCDLISRTYLEK